MRPRAPQPRLHQVPAAEEQQRREHGVRALVERRVAERVVDEGDAERERGEQQPVEGCDGGRFAVGEGGYGWRRRVLVSNAVLAQRS